MQKWLSKNTLRVHAAVFVVIILASALLYLAAQAQTPFWIWLLVGVIALGNLATLLTK